MTKKNNNGEGAESASYQKRKVTFRHADEKRLRELGLWNVDELVISLGPARKISAPAAKKET
jgi:hypothetical protein